MRTRTLLFIGGVIASLAIGSACADRPTEPTAAVSRVTSSSALGARADGAGQEKVAICHFSGEGARIVSVALPALDAHVEHDDYVAGLVVDKRYVGVADGIHFGRIGDAIAAARASRLAHGELETAACRITIAVGPGVFAGAATPNADPASELFPLVLDVPDVTLTGSFVMQLDGRDRATGAAYGAEATVIAPSSPLPVTANVSLPVFVVNGHPAGSKGNGVVIEGFVLRSGHTGVGANAGETAA